MLYQWADSASDMRFELVMFAVILFVLRWALNYMYTSGNLPPGPRANNIPVLGNLLFMGGKPMHEILTDMASRYGPVFRVHMGATKMVVVADLQLFREAFKNDHLAGRPRTPLVDGIMDGYGLTSSEGALWRSQRSFTHGCLRQLGMLRGVASQGLFQRNASNAVDLLIDEVTQLGGKPFDPERPLSFAAANILLATVMGKTFEPYDESVMEQLASIHSSFQLIEQIGLANFVPTLLWLPGPRRIRQTLLGRREDTRNFFRGIVEEHRATLDPQNPRDLIDHFLLQMQSDSLKKDYASHFTEVQLLSILGDLFSAGTETTKVTMRWLLLALLRKPHIQAKIQMELDSVVGRGRSPLLSDRPHLPYLEACFQEILRLSSIVPTGAPHSAMRDVVLGGYHIPRHAMVVGLLWKFHRDPAVWTTPDDFNPEAHFLSADGSLIRHHDHMLAFSTGRRVCLGEDVARSEMFLIMASLLQKFTFTPAEGVEALPTFNDVCLGLLRGPIPFEIVATVR